MIIANNATPEQIARANKIKLDKFLTDIYQDDEVKPVYTPEELANEMISKLPNMHVEILVVSDLGLLVIVLRKLKNAGKTYEQVTFIAHNEKQQAFSQKLGVKTLQIGYNNPIKELEKQLMGMKFDIIIGNPPYKAGMHLKFLELCFDSLSEDGEMIFVHPAEWLVQKRDTPKSRKYKILKEKLDKHVKSIEFIDNPWPEVRLYVPLTITYLSSKMQSSFSFNCNRTHGYGNVLQKPLSNKCTSLDECSTWGDGKIISSILKKAKANTNIKTKVYNGDYYVNLSGISGDGKLAHIGYDGIERTFYNMWNFLNSTTNFITNSPKYSRPRGGKEIGNEKHWVSFKTEQEANNFLAYITKNKLIKALTAIYKIDQHCGGVLDVLPMLDFNIEWTDELTYKHFNFTEEEIEAIENIVEMINVNAYK